MCAKDLKDTAAIWLEELNISGDTMVAMNHNLEDVPKEQQGSYNLFDLLDLFVDHVREGEELKQNADKALSLSGVVNSEAAVCDECGSKNTQTIKYDRCLDCYNQFNTN